VTTAAARRVALVTGGSNGIGLACARRLCEEGFEVVIAARNADRLERAARQIGARWCVLDCTDEEQAQAVLGEIGPVGLVVHAAGVLHARRARHQSAAKFDEVVRQNLTSAYVVARTFGTAMAAGSRLVIISSTAAIDPPSFLSAYGAAKAGVVTMARALRLELEPAGVAVHVVLPGTVDTEMMAANEVRRAAILAEDVASAVAWLSGLSHRVRVDELEMRPAELSPEAHFVEVTV
jgi:NAD(P)-dependent dehydrogenase (short-subunit alcohol dehydrogenase family)